MKQDTIKLLDQKGKAEIFTEERYNTLKKVMAYGMSRDEWLRMYLSLDPLNKSEWIADHMVELCEAGKI